MFSCCVLLQKERSLSPQLPLPGCTVITLSTGILSSPLAGSQHCRCLSLTLFCSFTSEHQLLFLTRLLGDLRVNAALGKSDCLAEMALSNQTHGLLFAEGFFPPGYFCVFIFILLNCSFISASSLGLLLFQFAGAPVLSNAKLLWQHVLS